MGNLKIEVTRPNSGEYKVNISGGTFYAENSIGTNIPLVTGGNTIQSDTKLFVFGTGVTSINFYESAGITELLIHEMDDLTSLYKLASSCEDLTKLNSLASAINITNLESMCMHCHSLEEFNMPDLDNVTVFKSAWNSCYKLPKINEGFIDMSKATTTSYAFAFMHELKTVHINNTSLSTDFGWMFYGSRKLICVGGTLDTTIATRTTSMFTLATDLIQPDTAIQADLINGDTWTNTNQCPAVENSNKMVVTRLEFMGAPLLEGKEGQIYTDVIEGTSYEYKGNQWRIRNSTLPTVPADVSATPTLADVQAILDYTKSVDTKLRALGLFM